MTKPYTCPVCFYGMDYPAADYYICPRCGTEFGLDDEDMTYQELREDWIALGCPQFFEDVAKPEIEPKTVSQDDV